MRRLLMVMMMGALVAAGAICLADVAAGGAAGKAAFKSAEANKAIVEAEAAEAKARAEFEKAMVPVRKKLIDSLTAAQEKATKAGDLDEAIKLREKINELKLQNAMGTAGSWLPGDWRVKAENGKFAGTLRFLADGQVTYVDHPETGVGRWVVEKGKLVITWGKINAVDTYLMANGNQLGGSSTSGDTLVATRVGN